MSAEDIIFRSKKISGSDRILCEEYNEKYKFVEEIGKGFYGKVYKIQDKKNLEFFAAKHVKYGRKNAAEKIDEEIHLLKKLDHKNLLRFKESYTTPQEKIIITEYLDGGELFQRVVDENYLSEYTAIAYLKQICSGVKYMHDVDVVHLDLKPENILCVDHDSNRIKIVDFGTAKQLIPGKEVKVMCGTAEFVSPEVINFEEVSPKSDTWSVGVITYVLLSGYSPFLGDTNNDTYANIIKLEYDFDEPEFEIISDSAKNFVESLLRKRPRERMSAEDCLRHEWLRCEEGASKVALDKNVENLRKLLQARWQKSMKAIKALSRLSSNFNRRHGSKTYSDQQMSSTEEESKPQKSPIRKDTPIYQEQPKLQLEKQMRNVELSDGIPESEEETVSLVSHVSPKFTSTWTSNSETKK